MTVETEYKKWVILNNNEHSEKFYPHQPQVRWMQYLIYQERKTYGANQNVQQKIQVWLFLHICQFHFQLTAAQNCFPEFPPLNASPLHAYKKNKAKCFLFHL